MEQFFNLSFWTWMLNNCSPAAWTRAWFGEWNDTHKKNH